MRPDASWGAESSMRGRGVGAASVGARKRHESLGA